MVKEPTFFHDFILISSSEHLTLSSNDQQMISFIWNLGYILTISTRARLNTM